MTELTQRYEAAIETLVPSVDRYTRYQRLLFEGIPLHGRSMLDIGGGSGIMSFYAASHGSGPVTCLEPAGDGSNAARNDQFRLFEVTLGEGANVQMVHTRFQDLDPNQQRYDIVLIHNAINHLDEEACAALPAQYARRRYGEMFLKLAALVPAGGDLVFADCGRKNMLGDLRMHNPLAPTIEWHIHQQPQTWIGMLLESGFGFPRISWPTPVRLRRPGQVLLGNRLGGYLTSSQFIVSMRRNG